MASFLDEIGKTIFGQQDAADYKQYNAGEQLAAAQGLLPQIGSFNQQVAQQQLGLIPIQNQMRGALYGQAINPLQSTYTQSILDNLNLGNQLPADVQQQVIQNALQGSAASGFGLSPGGRGLVGRDLGLSSLQIGGQRRAEALGALNSFRAPELQGQLSPTTALDMQMNELQSQNFKSAQDASLRNANRAAIISSLSQYAELGGSVFGSAVGSAFGTKGMGSGFSAILGGLGKGGAGRFSAGEGSNYVGDGGQVMTSTRAMPVQNY